MSVTDLAQPIVMSVGSFNFTILLLTSIIIMLTVMIIVVTLFSPRTKSKDVKK